VGLSSAYSFVQTNQGFVGLSSYERKMITKVEAFTVNGTFTPPAGVTYAVAHMRGGGGGAGGSTAGGTGGTSSVAFASGTITATGGNGSIALGGPPVTVSGTSRPANSGLGAFTAANLSDTIPVSSAADGAYIIAGGAVTAGTGISVTVGAGGTAGAGGGQAGGSGYVWIEYQVAV
jgi:hypothetical protein